MKTLSTFLDSLQLSSELNTLIAGVLAPSFVQIRRIIETSQGGYSETQNASGESQLKLDVATNNILVDALKASPLVHSLASEELDDAVACNSQGAFALAFDPLDGSSLVDANLAVGTIFGIYPTGANPQAFSFIGQKGRSQVAAGVVIYGPKTTMLLAIPGHGVHFFELNGGDFVYVRGPVTIASESKYFAPGNARAAKDRPVYLEVINEWINRGLTLRYSGGMVPDVGHIFVKGSGVFAYPGYSDAPQGKLRILFECNPISLLIETAGGVSSDGHQPILDKSVKELHERTPIFCGSAAEVQKVADTLKL